MRRVLLIATGMLVAAFVVSNVVDGWVNASDAKRAASQIGHGFTAEDVFSLKEVLTGDRYSSTKAGTVIFWAMWVGGTAFFALPRGRRSSERGRASVAQENVPRQPPKPMSQRAQTVLFVAMGVGFVLLVGPSCRGV